MIRPGHSRICTIVTLLLIASLTSTVTRADDGKSEIRLRANVPVGPIGTVISPGAVKINGRALYGEQAIWRGDLVEAPSDTNARVSLDSIGQITLATGAAMTIAATSSNRDDQTIHRVLIATVIEGEISVRLQPEASAYIEASGSVINADKGASFRLRVEDQTAQVDAFIGEVNVAPQHIIPSYYKVRLVVPAPPGAGARKSAPRTSHVPPGQSKLLDIEAQKRDKVKFVSTKFMPLKDEPAKNLRIRFELDPQTIGTLNPVETTTDEFGIATTLFTAGSNRGKAKFTATVVDNPIDKYVGKIVVGEKPSIFRLRNILIAAGVIGAVVIICCKRPSNPMKQDPPIIIEP